MTGWTVDHLLISSKINFKNKIEEIQDMFPKNIALSIDKTYIESNGDETNYLDMKLTVTEQYKLSNNQFNVDLGCENHINYDKNYIIDSTLHEKPNTLFTCTHRNSNIPLSLKTGTIRGELIRRVKVCSTFKEYNKHKLIYFKRLKRWGYTSKFIRWYIKHPNYFLRDQYIRQTNNTYKHEHKYKQYKITNPHKYKRKLFFVKKFNINLDNKKYLYYLINKYLIAANLLKDYNIIICNKTGDNIKTIIQIRNTVLRWF